MNLTKQCGELAIERNPVNCADDLSFPRAIFFGPPKTVIQSTGDIPTATEVQAAIDAGHIMTTGRITNGVKIPAEMDTISGADTEDGMETIVREITGITGSIRRLNANFLRAFSQNNLNMNQRFQIWYTDDNGYFFGGKNGYLGSLYFPSYDHGGQGQKAQVPLNVKWVRNQMQSEVYNAVPDIAYLDLMNFSPTYVLGQINTMAVGNDASGLTIEMIRQTGAREVVTAKLPNYQTAVAAASGISDLTALQTVIDTVNVA